MPPVSLTSQSTSRGEITVHSTAIVQILTDKCRLWPLASFCRPRPLTSKARTFDSNIKLARLLGFSRRRATPTSQSKRCKRCTSISRTSSIKKRNYTITSGGQKMPMTAPTAIRIHVQRPQKPKPQKLEKASRLDVDQTWRIFKPSNQAT